MKVAFKCFKTELEILDMRKYEAYNVSYDLQNQFKHKISLKIKDGKKE